MSNDFIQQYGFKIVPLSHNDSKGPGVTKLDRRDAVLTRPPRVWWVNQSTSYRKGLHGHSLWAALTREDGHVIPHWKRLEEVRAGDVILHYGKPSIRAVSLATSDGYQTPRPLDHSRLSKINNGIKVDADYLEFAEPIPIHAFVSKLLDLKIPNGPLDKNGDVKLGYCFEFNLEGLQILKQASNKIWPDWTNLSPQLIIGLQMSDFARIFSSLQQQRLYFTEETLSNYLLALQTKRFVILSGISGTGKTQLALAVAKFFRKKVQVDTQSESPQHAVRMMAQPYQLLRDASAMLENQLLLHPMVEAQNIACYSAHRFNHGSFGVDQAKYRLRCSGCLFCCLSDASKEKQKPLLPISLHMHPLQESIVGLPIRFQVKTEVEQWL